MKLTGLVIAPHSTLKYWDELGIVLRNIDNENVLDGFTFVKFFGKNFNNIYFLEETDFFNNQNNNNISIPNINNIISRDRWLRNLDYNKSVNFCNNIYNKLENIILEKRYDFFIGEVSCATNEIALILSIKYKIQFYNLTTSLYKNKYFLYNSSDIYGNKNFIQKKINSNEFTQFVYSDQLYNNQIISKLKNNKFKPKYNVFVFIKNLLLNFLLVFKFKKKYFVDQNNNFLTNITAILRLFFNTDNKYYKNKINLIKENYFLYYLHFEPDLSTVIWANNYEDQLYLISIIAKNLPNNTKLFVKEHPLSRLIRPKFFYINLLKIPNVVLIDSTFDSYSLISNSKGVLTLTGSVGYEAWLMGKPVVVFGNVFYDNFDNVFICKDFDTLFDTLYNILSTNNCNIDYKIRKKIDQFIFEKCTIEGSIFNYEHYFDSIEYNEKLENMKNICNHLNTQDHEK